MVRLSLLAAVSLGAALVANADKNSIDCPMRQLMLQFGGKAIPTLTKLQLRQLADALEGSATGGPCSLDVAEELGGATLEAPRVRSSASSTWYVSPSGSDSGSGTSSSPFKTVTHAVSVSRSVQGSKTIILDDGTYYEGSTIELGASDSHLTIMAAPGAKPWLSGALPLDSLSWQPYNVSSNTSTWTVLQNENAVYGWAPGDSWGALYGKTDNASACQAACAANHSAGGACTVYTWHDKNQGSYAFDCIFRLDHQYSDLHEESGHTTGYMTAPKAVWKAALPAGTADFDGLRVPGGGRAIRARYPNAIPETEGFGSTLSADSWTPPLGPVEPEKEYAPSEPSRNTSTWFSTFYLGVGGVCQHFSPPGGYWCSSKTSGGGAFTVRFPSGATLGKDKLPNSPYKTVNRATMPIWRPAHWSTWAAGLCDAGYDAATGNFSFAKCTPINQGARGSNSGEHLYVENIFEELDAALEWYFDVDGVYGPKGTLYFASNVSSSAVDATPPPATGFVATALRTILRVSGSQAAPAQNITISGIGFRDAALTYMGPHSMPSGGDWALERVAALFVEGAEGFKLTGCNFTRNDGNAVMLSSYVRDAELSDNEIQWTGGNAIALWGNSTGVPEALGMGPDATPGDYPLDTLIARNFIHEVGIFMKQMSFFFQAKSGGTTLLNNIGFNGPRAGFNFNDGFYGDNKLIGNFIGNAVRESGDHGPFNSWDRQVWQWKDRDGKVTTDKTTDQIAGNFILGTYETQEAIDNDDGSRRFDTYGNVFYLGGNDLKSDFGGTLNNHTNNVVVYVGHGYGITNQQANLVDTYRDNYLVLDGDNIGSASGCEKATVHADTGNNQYFTPDGKGQECGMDLSAWQAKGFDKGSTVAPYPSDDAILTRVKSQLGL